MARNLFEPSIKIIDDKPLRDEIVKLYMTKNQLQINLWSLDILNHVLSVVEFEDEIREVIQLGIDISHKWQNCSVRAHDIRQIGFKIHSLANQETVEVRKVALRTIGQAISSAHMKEHGIVASDYHIKLLHLISDLMDPKSIRLIQLEWLKHT